MFLALTRGTAPRRATPSAASWASLEHERHKKLIGEVTDPQATVALLNEARKK